MNRKEMKKSILRLLANEVFSDLHDIHYEGNYEGIITKVAEKRWVSVQLEVQRELDRRAE